MELHRLKPMSDNYDKDLFNQLYSETENLRNSLVYQIDPRRYNVTKDIVKSWFDDKFIFVFSKYYGTMPNDRLKGYIINSLQIFKYRVLRKAYTKQYTEINLTPLEDDYDLINIIPDKNELSDHNLFLELALKFLKTTLSKEAFQIMEIELNPPPFIMNKMVNPKTKIPTKLIVGYLGIEDNKKTISYINSLRREINQGVVEAKEYFSTN